MMIPIHCFTCGAMIDDKWEDDCRVINVEHKPPREALEALGIRRMLLTHVDLIEKMLPYSRTDAPDDRPL